MNYKFTKHAITRFKQRFPELIGAEKSIAYHMAKDLYKNGKINSSIKNNTRLMTELYANHGYDSMDFIVSDLVVYVIRSDDVVTVYGLNDSVFSVNNSRFRKNNKKGT